MKNSKKDLALTLSFCIESEGLKTEHKFPRHFTKILKLNPNKEIKYLEYVISRILISYSDELYETLIDLDLVLPARCSKHTLSEL